MTARTNIIVRMIKAEPIGIVSLAIGIVTIVFASMAYSQQGKHNAWTIIASHAPGNSGIKSAMEYLYEKKENLRDIDLRPISDAYADVPGIHHANINFAKLKGIDLSYAWLDRTDFSSADLTGSKLDFAQMTFSKLNDVTLTDASLKDAFLQQTSMRGTDATCLKAKGITLTKSTIENSKLDASDLEKVVMDNVRIIHSSFVGVDFSGGFLPGSTLLDVNLTDTKFKGTELAHMKVYGANISGANFFEAKGLDSVVWSGVWAWSDKIPKFPEGAKPVVRIYDKGCREGEWLDSKPPIGGTCSYTDDSEFSSTSSEVSTSYFLNRTLCKVFDRKTQREKRHLR